MQIQRILLALLLAVHCSSSLNGDEFKDSASGISVTTNDDWNAASERVLAALNQMSAKGAQVHALKKEVRATPETVGSRIILFHSKHKISTSEDNPNLILAVENVWTDAFEKSGLGYLELMKDRVKLLGAPTELIGKPVELKIGDTAFYWMDALNTKVPEAKTKQRYICTHRGGRYIYFVLSINDEKDEDFKKMMTVVESFRYVPAKKG